jgi:hypothetical protein
MVSSSYYTISFRFTLDRIFVFQNENFYRNNLDQTCEVFYIDYGNMEELPIDFVHEILPDFARLPARAIACTIAEVKKQ